MDVRYSWRRARLRCVVTRPVGFDNARHIEADMNHNSWLFRTQAPLFRCATRASRTPLEGASLGVFREKIRTSRRTWARRGGTSTTGNARRTKGVAYIGCVDGIRSGNRVESTPARTRSHPKNDPARTPARGSRVAMTIVVVARRGRRSRRWTLPREQ